ncbi:MAG: hypothetical protein ACI9GW_003757 [Halieaceae bacterium]|jgi:hypothetical protein
MATFDDIRPFNDSEVPAVIARLLDDRELQNSIAMLQLGTMHRFLPSLARTLVRFALRRQFGQIEDVAAFQAVVDGYMERMVAATTDGFSLSGLEELTVGQPYLLISNHRDITMDPAFTSWGLHRNGHTTARIAIGDNLLSRPFVSDLMRLNKSFVVNRSAKAPRQILAALRNLSKYIRHSLLEEHESVWIAQREGRAKDGCDKTEPSIIKMLSMSMDKHTQTLAEHVTSLAIVPVAVSYELDPCDSLKARELYETALHGNYDKDEGEDISSIAMGIEGKKGKVHVAFGEPLKKDYQSPEEVAADLDAQILRNYHLFPSNFIAYQISTGTLPDIVLPGESEVFRLEDHREEQERFERRLAAIPEPHRPYLLRIYANPVLAKIGLIQSQ